MDDTLFPVVILSYLFFDFHSKNIFLIAVMMCILQHHILYLHQTNLGTSLIFIQFHGNVLDALLCLWDNHMLQCIDTPPGFLNLTGQQLAVTCPAEYLPEISPHHPDHRK